MTVLDRCNGLALLFQTQRAVNGAALFRKFGGVGETSAKNTQG